MPNDDPESKEDALEAHSLPGTNQAGKGPGADDGETPNPDGDCECPPGGPEAAGGSVTAAKPARVPKEPL